MLYFVATPIGNLKELTHRAVEVLNAVDCIYAENPRHTQTLLTAYCIQKPTFLYEKFSEKKTVGEIVTKLRDGRDIAIVSDAGTPLICDPGAVLVDTLVEANEPFTVVSGPCAAINAAVLSGMDTSVFLTAGFLPQKTVDRERFIARFQSLSATLIFYSAVHDLQKDLKFLGDALGNRKAAVVREMTKKFEEVVRFRLKEVPPITLKGEFVIVIEGAQERPEAARLTVREKLLELIAAGCDKKEADKIVAAEYGLPKSEVYRESIGI